ncbi:MAG: hypothetical protein KDN05_04310 [Verrucomicrobiae bacterium]|nr:hypothetical protein [Verrucomicrobiae bacterium]MCP5533196.1 hypothetical protein [Akkermansiaceae bacterium]
MKPNLPPLFAAVVLLATASSASAQVDATSWTSVGGTTIWARLDGIAGDKVILNMRGKEYRVPMSRLAPRSIEKARTMWKLKETPAPAAGLPKPSVHSFRDIEIPDIDPPAGCVPPPVPDMPVIRKPGAAGGADLPGWNERAEVDADSYAAVLPSRPAAPSGVRALGKTVQVSSSLPGTIRNVVSAANHLQDKPYKWGGGHGSIHDNGYDCSGSVSYVLIRAGLLRRPLTSGSFTRYGEAGPGRWITIYARNGHVFMTICGIRFDTGGGGEKGPRWRHQMRTPAGFVARHPPGC